MVEFACVSCGAILRVDDGSDVCICEHCKTEQLVPSGLSGYSMDDFRFETTGDISNDYKVQHLLDYGFSLMKDGEVKQSLTVFHEVLKINPENGDAYIGIFISNYNMEAVSNNYGTDSLLKSVEDLGKIVYAATLYKSAEFKKGIINASSRMKVKLYEAVGSSLHTKAFEYLDRYGTPDEYERAAEIFRLIPGYRDSETLEKEAYYLTGKYYMSAKPREYDKAGEYFRKIPGYKDADELLLKCMYSAEKIDEKKKENLKTSTPVPENPKNKDAGKLRNIPRASVEKIKGTIDTLRKNLGMKQS